MKKSIMVYLTLSTFLITSSLTTVSASAFSLNKGFGLFSNGLFNSNSNNTSNNDSASAASNTGVTTQNANSSEMLTFGETAQMSAKERLGEIFFMSSDDASHIKQRRNSGVYDASNVVLGGSKVSRNKIDPATLSTDVKINWPAYTYEVGATRPTNQNQLAEKNTVELNLPLAWIWRCTNSFAQTKPQIGKDDSYTGSSEIVWNEPQIDKVACFFNVAGTVTKIDKTNPDYICKVNFEITKEVQENIKKKIKMLRADDRLAYAKSRLEAISEEHFVRAIALKGDVKESGENAAGSVAVAGFVSGTVVAQGSDSSSSSGASGAGGSIVVSGAIVVTGVNGEELVSDDRRLGGEAGNEELKANDTAGAISGTIGAAAASAQNNENNEDATSSIGQEESAAAEKTGEDNTGNSFEMMMALVTTMLLTILGVIVKLISKVLGK